MWGNESERRRRRRKGSGDESDCLGICGVEMKEICGVGIFEKGGIEKKKERGEILKREMRREMQIEKKKEDTEKLLGSNAISMQRVAFLFAENLKNLIRMQN